MSSEETTDAAPVTRADIEDKVNELVGDVEVHDGLVEEVLLSPYATGSGEPMTRIEVTLSAPADYQVMPGSEGLMIRVEPLPGMNASSASADGEQMADEPDPWAIVPASSDDSDMMPAGDPEPMPVVNAEPATTLALTCAVEFDHPAVGRQCLRVDPLDAERFEREIAPARTFGFLRDQDVLREAGFAASLCSPDTAHSATLESYGKSFTRPELERAVEALAAARIPSMFCFILGGPGETRERLEALRVVPVAREPAVVVGEGAHVRGAEEQLEAHEPQKARKQCAGDPSARGIS